MRLRMLFAALAFLPTTAVAQPIEVGGTLAAACQGSEGSLCDGTGPLVGARLGWWVADRIELLVAASRLTLPASEYVSFDPPLRISVTDRSRRFASAVFSYHFRRGRAVRPMLGFGSGLIVHTDRTDCSPAGCEALLTNVAGEQRSTLTDAIFVVGLSGAVRGRWIWRGGWQAHRFGNEGDSTEEFFVGIGYRFGSR